MLAKESERPVAVGYRSLRGKKREINKVEPARLLLAFVGLARVPVDDEGGAERAGQRARTLQRRPW